jgi:hypothetical protein
MGVRVSISPETQDGDVSEWTWAAEIVVENHLYEDSDENGDFTIERCGIDCFYSADEAVTWVYRWLTSRGYDTAYIELVVKPIYSRVFHRTKVTS